MGIFGVIAQMVSANHLFKLHLLAVLLLLPMYCHLTVANESQKKCFALIFNALQCALFSATNVCIRAGTSHLLTFQKIF